MDFINSFPAPLLLAIKEAGRVLLMAVVSYAVAYFAALPQTEAVLIGTIVLRAIDKFLHDLGKEVDNDRLKKGLTQF